MGWISDLLKEIPSAARYKSELEAMEKENASLKSEVAKLREEIQQRDDIVGKEDSHGKHLEEVKEKILMLLAQQEELEAEQISRQLNIGSQLAIFHLEELKDSEMVKDYYAMDSPVYWGIIQGGRAYLVRHGLLA